MFKPSTLFYAFIISVSCLFVACSGNNPATAGSEKQTASAEGPYHGYGTQVKYGEHLVSIGGCNDCHTPKKMTEQGPVPDSSLLLSGHPEHMPPPDIDRVEVERKGLGVTNTLTSWVGPWGVSFAANLTSDSTGIGNWKEEQFMYALKNGMFKGLPGTRPLLPPMPVTSTRSMTDEEIKAIFAYLKSIKPINNVVPTALPPTTASR